MRSSRGSRSSRDPISTPTSAGPDSRLSFLTYSKRVTSSSGPEHLVEEAAQGAGLLGELDEEVVLEALEAQRALDDLGVAGDVVVAAGEHDDHGLARHEVEPGPSGRIAAPASAPAGSAMMPSVW